MAAVLVYEELPMLSVLRACEGAGATVLAEGPVAVTDIDTTLTAAGAER